MNDFVYCLVEDIAAPIRNALVGGPFGSNLVSSDYVEDGVPVIRGQNMGMGRWVTGEFAYVSSEKARSLSSNIARPRDLIFTQRGTLGQVAIVPDTGYSEYVVSQSQMKLTPDPARADVLFLYYYFRSPEQQLHILNNAIQTGVPHTNLSILRNTPVILPPLAEQRAIAQILGTLDDKIELNRRMNATLEATARALFQSWFVDFDPVHAKARGEQPAGMDAATAALFPDSFEESALGLIPAGWRVGMLGDVLELAYGKALKADKRNDGNVPVYGSNGLVGWHDEKLASGPGIVVGRKGNPGTVTWVSVDFFPIDTTFYVVPKDSSPPLEFLLFLLELQDLPSLSADSAVPGLNRNIAYMNKLIWPDESLAKLFTSIAQSVLGKIAQNEHESRTLAETRDALLPKLVSGEVRVGEI